LTQLAETSPMHAAILRYFRKHPGELDEVVAGQVEQPKKGNVRAFEALANRTDGPPTRRHEVECELELGAPPWADIRDRLRDRVPAARAIDAEQPASPKPSGETERRCPAICACPSCKEHRAAQPPEPPAPVESSPAAAPARAPEPLPPPVIGEPVDAYQDAPFCYRSESGGVSEATRPERPRTAADLRADAERRRAALRGVNQGR
jgi:hypothetical protein